MGNLKSMTNRDLIFIISAIVWLISNILAYIFYKSDGVTISNFIFIILFGSVTLIKIKNRKFGNWLEN